ncbi:hypothetical protein DFJ73DRAFT_957284 [Zopfochytrium polystomum]|nr:hypothetical protein DFJ73DRAFT_957284 [Zopfochytrium polystomum]
MSASSNGKTAATSSSTQTAAAATRRLLQAIVAAGSCPTAAAAAAASSASAVEALISAGALDLAFKSTAADLLTPPLAFPIGGDHGDGCDCGQRGQWAVAVEEKYSTAPSDTSALFTTYRQHVLDLATDDILGWAARMNRGDLFPLLTPRLAGGIGRDSQNALFKAASNGHAELVRQILATPGSSAWTQRSAIAVSALTAAAGRRDLEIVRALLEAGDGGGAESGPDTARGANLEAAMAAAASEADNVACVKLLLSHGANPAAYSDDPVRMGVERGELELVTVLADAYRDKAEAAGKDVGLLFPDDVLDTVVSLNRVDIARVLLERGIRFAHVDTSEATAELLGVIAEFSQ